MALPGRVQLLTRLLLQMQPAVIHNINSRVAWQAFAQHGLALRQKSGLFASLFCDDRDEEGFQPDLPEVTCATAMQTW